MSCMPHGRPTSAGDRCKHTARRNHKNTGESSDACNCWVRTFERIAGAVPPVGTTKATMLDGHYAARKGLCLLANMRTSQPQGMVRQPVAQDVVRVQGLPDRLELSQVEPLLQVAAQLSQAPGSAVEVQIDFGPMENAAVLEGEIRMPHSVFAEL